MDQLQPRRRQRRVAEASKRRAPLYGFAISSKRYALFNVGADGTPIIRKASAHGLGHVIAPYGDDQAPAHIPSPLKEVISGKEKLQRWRYDAWFAILSAALDGQAHHVKFDYHPNLLKPTVSRYNATSPDILSWVDPYNAGKPYPDQIKPCGFLYLLHPSTFWTFNDQRVRQLAIVEAGVGQPVQIRVRGFEDAHRAGLHFYEAGQALKDQDLYPDFVRRWEGQRIRDVSGRWHVLSTDLNQLYIVLLAQNYAFERFYKIET